MTEQTMHVPGLPGEWTFPLPPAKAIPVNNVAGQRLYSGACVLVGWSLQNHGAAADICTIYDGLDANGTNVAIPRNAAGTSDSETCGPSGVLCKIGVYMTQSNQSTNGAVWVIPL